MLTGSLAASAAANARIPQALAICKGRAAQVMAGSATPLVHPGLLKFLMLQAQVGQRQTDIMNGCLAEYGWVVQQANP